MFVTESPALAQGLSKSAPGVFSKEDQYIRCRWHQVQYMSDLFRKRWIREYLPFLQECQKWLYPERNVQVGDVVLVVDPSAPRGS